MKKKFQILLINDDIDDQCLFEIALKKSLTPTQLTVIEDGEKLIQFFKGDVRKLPDVIFLGLNSRVRNGYRWLEEIKGNKAFKDIMVIIYSTCVHEEVADRQYQDGVYLYLKKCGLHQLSASINKAISTLKSNSARPSRDRFTLNGYENNFLI